jgi:hypothetical protein
MNDQILDIFDSFGLGVTVLDFCTSFVVEVNHCHTDNSIFYLLIALIVFIHYLFQQQSFPFEFFVGVGNVYIGIGVW